MLDFETIKKITVGAVDIWQDESGVHFSKCTKEQHSEWAKIDPPCIYDNTLASTGVRFDFHTNSPFVEVETSSGNKFEVKINGVLMHRFTRSEGEPIKFKIDLDGKENHIVIYMPSHNPCGVIKSVSIADGASITPHSFDKKFLFLGDSITQGWDSKYDSLSFAYLISEFFNAESVIQGIGTACFEPTVVYDMGFDPEVVFVAFGTNDFGQRLSFDLLKSRAQGYLEKIKNLYSKSKIFVITPIWRVDYDIITKAGDFESCKKAVGDCARSLGLTVVNGDKLVPPNRDFMADYWHPNDLGFTVYAINLLREIVKSVELK